LVLVAILAAGNAYGERLPVEVFMLAHGLASNTIHKIVRDSRGFLWFCTGDGLSGFDGHQFVNFRLEHGLPGRNVLDVLESRAGDYWVATNAGLVQIPGNPGRKLQVIRTAANESPAVYAVKETADGTIWVGTHNGLYRISLADPWRMTRVDTGPLPESWNEPAVLVLEEDSMGNLWFGGNAGLGRINRDGRVHRWTPREGFITYIVVALYKDTEADGLADPNVVAFFPNAIASSSGPYSSNGKFKFAVGQLSVFLTPIVNVAR
jgi:ligand-binding sensor domain-containing protein